MESLRAIRKQRRLTQAQLAAMVGVNQATISKIEGGNDSVTLDMVYRIAAALNVPAGALFPQGELENRLLIALSQMGPERRAAAVVVIEAMAGE
jgi:transcriptional regulator with XRE-family HTH domain